MWGSVNLWFRCDVTQVLVVRPVEGTCGYFYHNSSPLRLIAKKVYD